MFKKTMTFDDLNGDEVTQTFYFNYNKKEIAELMEFGAIQEYADPNRDYLPLEETLKLLSTPTEESGLTNTQNNRQAYQIFQDLILDAYGVKGDDNVSFDKSAKLRHYWSTHVAFPELIFEFLGNTQLAAEFIENCLPQKMVAAAKAEMATKTGQPISSVTLTEMVHEADRRQKDPATRIEPGPEAARLALAPDPAVEKLATDAASSSPAYDLDNLTETDILEMDEETFAKLDPLKLSKEQMQVAFRRKMGRV